MVVEQDVARHRHTLLGAGRVILRHRRIVHVRRVADHLDAQRRVVRRRQRVAVSDGVDQRHGAREVQRGRVGVRAIRVQSDRTRRHDVAAVVDAIDRPCYADGQVVIDLAVAVGVGQRADHGLGIAFQVVVVGQHVAAHRRVDRCLVDVVDRVGVVPRQRGQVERRRGARHRRPIVAHLVRDHRRAHEGRRRLPDVGARRRVHRQRPDGVAVLRDLDRRAGRRRRVRRAVTIRVDQRHRLGVALGVEVVGQDVAHLRHALRTQIGVVVGEGHIAQVRHDGDGQRGIVAQAARILDGVDRRHVARETGVRLEGPRPIWVDGQRARRHHVAVLVHAAHRRRHAQGQRIVDLAVAVAVDQHGCHHDRVAVRVAVVHQHVARHRHTLLGAGRVVLRHRRIVHARRVAHHLDAQRRAVRRRRQRIVVGDGVDQRHGAREVRRWRVGVGAVRVQRDRTCRHDVAAVVGSIDRRGRAQRQRVVHLAIAVGVSQGAGHGLPVAFQVVVVGQHVAAHRHVHRRLVDVVDGIGLVAAAEAEVEGVVGLALHHHRHRAGRVVGVVGPVALVDQGRRVAVRCCCREGEPGQANNRRIAGRAGVVVLVEQQVANRVKAVGVRDSRHRSRLAVGIQDGEGHQHACQPRLAGVLDAVDVEVIPHEVAQRRRRAVVAVVHHIAVAAAGRHRVGIGLALAGDARRAQRVPQAEENVAGVGHVHGVAAVGQAGEAVGAGRVRRRRSDHVAIGVVQDHRHTCVAAGLRAVQHAVRVDIIPDRAADGVRIARRRIAEVLVQMNEIQCADGDGRLIGSSTVRVHRVGQARAAVGQRSRVDLDHIGSNGQAAEVVVAVLVGGGRRQHDHAGGVVQPHRHPFQALAWIEGIVAVAIQEDGVADQAVSGRLPGRRVAEVVVQVGRRAVHGQRVPVVQRGIRVARLHELSQHVGCVVDPHRVSSGRQAGEGVVARGIGRRRSDDVAAAVEQRHRHTGDARLARVVLPIAVQIQVDQVANGAALVGLIAEVRVDEHVPWRQHDGLRRAVVAGRAELAIRIRVAGLRVARGRDAAVDQDHVSAGRHVVEDIVAVGVGGGARHQIVVDAVAVGIAVKLDKDAGEARLTGILAAVAVGIDPHPVADRAGGA